MNKEELLKKLVYAFYYEMDWESKENIDSAMTLCLPIIEEYAQSKVNNVVLDGVSGCYKPTKRDYFIAKAMQGLLAGRTEYEDPQSPVKIAIDTADYLLKEMSNDR